MHELSIVQALLDRVAREAERHAATAVTRLTLRVGELAGLEVPLLASAFDLVRTGTLCAGAELTIVPEPVAWACPRCGAAIPTGGRLACTPCGVPARLTAGGELILERIEMEVADG